MRLIAARIEKSDAMPPSLEFEVRSRNLQALPQPLKKVVSRPQRADVKESEANRRRSFGLLWMRLWLGFSRRRMRCDAILVLGVVPSGKGRKRLGTAGVAMYLRAKSPSPDPTWREAGALFSCSLHLRYLIRGSTHQHHLGTHWAAGASEATVSKKRGTCRPPSFSPFSLPTGPSSVAHHLRPTLSRLSLVTIGLSACMSSSWPTSSHTQLRQMVPDGLATRVAPPTPSSTSTHIRT